MTLSETLLPLGITSLNPNLFNQNTLQFTTCIKSGCKSMNFTDLTGSYNALTNPNGWIDSPNEKIYNVNGFINLSVLGQATLPITPLMSPIPSIGELILVTGLEGVNNNLNGYQIVTNASAISIVYATGNPPLAGFFPQTNAKVFTNQVTLPVGTNKLPNYTLSTTKAILAIYNKYLLQPL